MIKEETIKQNPEPKNLHSLQSVKSLLLSLLIVSVIYFNIFLILVKFPGSPQVTQAGKFFHKITFQSDNVPLPISLFIPKTAYDLFDTFSVFAYYETINRDFIISGLKEGATDPNDQNNWIELPVVDRYFPYHLGEQQTRLYLGKHYGLGATVTKQSYKELAAKIRERYNRENPTAKVQKIAIIVSYWPRSSISYRALKAQDTTQFQPMYVEE